MANNAINKQLLVYHNSIEDQMLTHNSQLILKSWNNIINVLKTQANVNADYIKKLHRWLFGDGTGEARVPGTQGFVEYVLSYNGEHGWNALAPQAPKRFGAYTADSDGNQTTTPVVSTVSEHGDFSATTYELENTIAMRDEFGCLRGFTRDSSGTIYGYLEDDDKLNEIGLNYINMSYFRARWDELFGKGYLEAYDTIKEIGDAIKETGEDIAGVRELIKDEIAEVDEDISEANNKITSLNIEGGTGTESTQQIKAIADGVKSAAFNESLAVGERSHSEGTSNIEKNSQGEYDFEVTYTIKKDGVDTPTDVIPLEPEPSSGSTTPGTAEYLDGTDFLSFSNIELKTTGAVGTSSHAEGYHTLARGNNSHTEGSYNYANGNDVHVEGCENMADMHAAHAEGFRNIVRGQASHAEGMGNVVRGKAAHAEGLNNRVDGIHSHVEGVSNIIHAGASHAEGYHNAIMAGANSSHVEGSGNKVSSYDSHAEGTNNTVSGSSSHVEGSNNVASGVNSHAGGNSTEASGESSFTLGKETRANGKFSFAGGLKSVAGSDCSFAYGNQVKAPAWTGFAINYYTEAATSHSFVAGVHTKSSREAQTVVGSSNNDNSNALFIVGNGDYTGANVTRKSNAFVVLKDGRAKVYEKPKEDNDVVRLQELNTKLTKITTTSDNVRVYTINPDGTNSNKGVVATSATASTIVMRNSSGQIVTAYPAAYNHAATKQYVDDIVGNIQTLLEAI